MSENIFQKFRDKFFEEATMLLDKFEKDILEKFTERGEIASYISDGYFIDIGVPQDYEKATMELPLLYPLNLSDIGSERL